MPTVSGLLAGKWTLKKCIKDTIKSDYNGLTNEELLL